MGWHGQERRAPRRYRRTIGDQNFLIVSFAASKETPDTPSCFDLPAGRFSSAQSGRSFLSVRDCRRFDEHAEHFRPPKTEQVNFLKTRFISYVFHSLQRLQGEYGGEETFRNIRTWDFFYSTCRAQAVSPRLLILARLNFPERY